MPATVPTSSGRSPKAVMPMPAAAVAVTTARNAPPLIMMATPPQRLGQLDDGAPAAVAQAVDLTLTVPAGTGGTARTSRLLPLARGMAWLTC
ncbi:hypothetical protein GCM10027067_23040 [Pseudactinotalea suaedae]